jgi:ribosomal protein S18 acetylase RimI-like enzyme
MEDLTIRPLAPAEVDSAARLLTTLNPETPQAVIAARLGTLLADFPHYHLFGAFAGGALVGVTGAWIATKVWCGLYLEIDNLVVDPAARSSGIGTMLMRHLEELALERDCKIMVIDSYSGNHASHRLYHRLGFEIWSFHFIKPIGDWKGSLT